MLLRKVRPSRNRSTPPPQIPFWPTTAAKPKGLRFVTWNIESDGNDPTTIARQLVELGRYDVYALQEVKGENFGRYHDAVSNAHGEGYRYFSSSTGRSDRLMVIFDSDRLQLLEVRELFQFNESTLNDWRHRSPLVAIFVTRRTVRNSD